MAYEQHLQKPVNNRRTFWPMYNSYGNTLNNSHSAVAAAAAVSTEHFLPASAFLQELIDCNRKQRPLPPQNNASSPGVMINNQRSLPPPPPPAPPSSQQQPPVNSPPQQQQQATNNHMQQQPDSNANLNNDQQHWNFMSQQGVVNGGGHNGQNKMGGWGDKNGGSNQLEDDFRLEYMVEYMELDEFLTENDIPLESVLNDQQQQPQIDDDPKRPSQQPQSQQSAKQMAPPSSALSPPVGSAGGLSMDGSTSQIKSECSTNSMSQFDRGSAQSPSDYLPPMSNSQQSLNDKGGVISLPPPMPPPSSLPSLDGSPSPGHCGGESGRDSGSLIRKRKKQMVSEERKDEKYWERRRKNNMAAKRSRDARRAKETQIAIQATILERENKNLTQELSKARAENLLLRERLQKYEPVV